MTTELVVLYEKIAAMTRPLCVSGSDECSKYSSNPHHCCEKKYCDIAAEKIKAAGIEVTVVGDEIPFLGPKGCVVPPHLRPVCAVHVCSISYADKSHIEHDPVKTQLYFDLRKRISELESQP
jgi:hypothetical protein